MAETALTGRALRQLLDQAAEEITANIENEDARDEWVSPDDRSRQEALIVALRIASDRLEGQLIVTSARANKPRPTRSTR